MTRAEPVVLVKQTIKALLAIKGDADEILIIDNNHTDKGLYQPLEAYCNSLHDSLKVRFHHIDFIEGYKAGALNLALALMDDACDYIMVIDSDYQVQPWARNSIVNAIQSYPNHALLQFPQFYRDTDKPDIHAELNYYFSQHLISKLNVSRTLSTGTCAVIRKDALLKLGGWSEESITEDAQMGVLMHLKGERTHYINEIIATGVLPQTMADLIAQRRRWIYGNMQVMSKYLKTLLVPIINTVIHSYKKDQEVVHTRLQPNLVLRLQQATMPKLDKTSGKLTAKYFKAHISQLSAWVNFTGPFIVLQGGCLVALLTAYLFNKPTLIEPTLKILGLCYSGYAVFMARKLMSYLRDSKPLMTPAGTTLEESNLSSNSSVAPIKPFDSNRNLLNQPLNKTLKTNSLESHTDRKHTRNVIQLTRRPLLSKRLQLIKKKTTQLINSQCKKSFNLRKPASIRKGKFNAFIKSKPLVVKRVLSKLTNPLNNRFNNRVKGKLIQSVKHISTVMDSKLHLRNTGERPTSTHSTQATRLSVNTPIKSRVRAWLVHLSFWELGALSWFPVLWGQQKPFVCTPKFDNLHSSGKSRLATLVVLPKLLLILNGLTALAVLPYSPLLFICALTVLVIKLAAFWVVMSNFSRSQPLQNTNRTIVFKKPKVPCDTSETNLA